VKAPRTAVAASDDRSNVLTVAGARRACAAKFRAAGIDSPELDARIIVGHALSLDHAALAAAASRRLDAGEATVIAALAARRLAHEPVARIVESKEFWSLRLHIDASTLVPRPETETLIEAALAAIDAGGPRSRKLRVADLGTGCGAILLALLSELPDAFGVGIDISPHALAIARDNARRLGLGRAEFAVCDMSGPLGLPLRGPFDLIVSNPPYIPTADIEKLAPEVRLYDPHVALDGGADGLRCYRAIAAIAPVLLAPGGAVVVELGAGLVEPVTKLFAAAGLAPSPPQPDLNVVPRAVVARKLQAGGHEAKALGPGKKALGMLAGTD
jgi:release factor glutamine methyltransferase